MIKNQSSHHLDKPIIDRYIIEYASQAITLNSYSFVVFISINFNNNKIKTRSSQKLNYIVKIFKISSFMESCFMYTNMSIIYIKHKKHVSIYQYKLIHQKYQEKTTIQFNK